MKTPAAKQLPSGSWNCVVMSKGIRRSFTAPTRTEAETAALKWKLEQEKPQQGTLGQAMNRYIENRQAVLSPSTVRRYKKFVELNFQTLQRRALVSLTQSEVQKEINAMRTTYSAKTVKNAWGFLSAVLRENGINYTVTLPQVIEAPHAFLEPEQIKPFVEEIKGYALELPILLGLHGLRRSEIIDLTWNDIDLKKSVLRVSGAAVQDSDGMWIHKEENKNQSSRREVPIMIPRLRELLGGEHGEGYVCQCHANSIYNAVNRACEKLGYPKIGVHGLRHTAVSLAYSKKVPEMACMRIFGYADFQTMRKIYTHLAQSDYEAATKNLTGFFANELQTHT